VIPNESEQKDSVSVSNLSDLVSQLCPHLMRTTLFLASVISSLLLHPSSFGQGSLTPPAAPAPTFKTLQQIEPRIDLQNAPASAVTTSDPNFHFIITQPGSYYLSANLAATKISGIQINAEGVTLDLNGFEVSRTPIGTSGIEIAATAHRATVRNGSIKGFATGVNSVLSGTFPRSCLFQGLTVSGCNSRGIRAGDGAVLEFCRVHDNSGGDGIFAGAGSTLSNCTASNNTTTHGISAGNGSTLSNCTANANVTGGSGVGISAGLGCSLINCSANNNSGDYGIKTSSSCSLTNCSVINNSVTFGIFAEGGSSLINCSASSNTGAALFSAGIGSGVQSTVTNCTASTNKTTISTTETTGMGIYVQDGSSVQNCTAVANSGDGINIGNNSLARENNCSGNGITTAGNAGGVHATGSDNRIEGNNVTVNDRGIDVDGTGNFIVRNTASGNTVNYAIVASNKDAQQLSPGSAFVSTDPWANFIY
jgi:parallel beta-helix repeat protein